MNDDFPPLLRERLQGLEYDLCVMTGDYRYLTHGPWDKALAGLQTIRPAIHHPIYAVLGNHDSLRMAPAIEDLNIHLLLNESVPLSRGDDTLYLAGIDDPHYFRTDNLDRASADIPVDAASILLGHSPEIFRQATHAGFDALLCGHTHGGQIRLPGGLALTYNANCPRRFCAGAWQHHQLQGYTSVGTGSSIVDLRYNCPPEITLHHLQRAQH
jgi:predicted MPP superfamily phosphohydrolase